MEYENRMTEDAEEKDPHTNDILPNDEQGPLEDNKEVTKTENQENKLENT